MKNKNLPFLIALLFVASALPSLIGFFSSNSDLIYSGVVFNPIDGYTYLAKMQIGISGDWLFTLPFTPDPGEGRMLYPFYIAAGRWLHQMGIPESVGFNLLRLVSYGLLILVLAKLSSAIYPDNERAERTALILMAFGGGLGWVLLPFGRFGADFWVAEAFPFLSGLANAHFPLALCLMVISILITYNSPNSWSMPALFLTGFALSILSPFGFVLLAGILTITWIWERVDGIRTPTGQVLAFVVSGIPYCGYQYWAVHSTPQLAAWTAQNQTPSPAIWDVLLTFSPWIILLIFCWKEIILLRKVPVVRRLIVWLTVGLIFTLIPYDLQRRFMIGLSIPFTALGLLVLPSAAHRLQLSTRKALIACAAVILPTPILLMVMTTMAVASHNPLYFYYRGEMTAIEWLAGQGNGRQLVMASGQTGNMIPAASRLRVVYGHPFETIQAESEEQAVSDFFAGIGSLDSEIACLDSRNVDWILYGPREKEIGLPLILEGKKPSTQFNGVSIFDVRELLN